jgi:hypothetical protein
VSATTAAAPRLPTCRGSAASSSSTASAIPPRWALPRSPSFSARLPSRATWRHLAVGVPRHPDLRRACDRPAPTPPPARIRASARGPGRTPEGGDPEARHLPYLPRLVRHTPARGRPRHPHGPRAPRASRRDHDHDLHARPQPRPRRGSEPRRSDDRSMTPSALHPCYADLAYRLSQVCIAKRPPSTQRQCVVFPACWASSHTRGHRATLDPRMINGATQTSRILVRR